MLLHQGGVKEESLVKGGLNMVDSFPVGRVEVSAKCKANPEEKVDGKNVRECTCNIRMMLIWWKHDLTSLG